MTLRRSAVFLALALAGPLAAREWQFKPVLDASLAAGHGAAWGQAGSWLGLGSLYAVPSVGTGSLALMPVIHASGSGQERSIQEGTIFVRSLEGGFAPALKWAPGPWSATLDLQALRTYNQETVDEGFGQGLYDYEQYGAGLAYQHTIGSAGENLRARVGMSHRSYPNNRNFAEAAALSGGKNYYYKDFDALALELRAQLLMRALTLRYSPEQRSYNDSLLVRPDGTLDLGQTRQDWLHRIQASLGLPLASGVVGSLALGLDFNDSNQNLLAEGLGPATFIPNHLDYAAQSLDLGLIAETSALWYRSRVLLGYSLGFTQSQRPVQRLDGSYLNEKEQGQSHRFSLGLEKFLPKGFKWQSGVSLLVYRSNQQYSAGLQPSYEYWQVQTGVQYTFKGRD